MEFTDCLREQARLHPSMEARDIMKHCYQAAFGAEHLLRDETAARAALEAELCGAAAHGEPLFEQLAPEVFRVNLSAWRGGGLPTEWLYRMFAASAAARPAEAERALSFCLGAAEELIARGELPVAMEKWRAFRASYETSGGGAVRHSAAFRAREHPAYRVVTGRYIRLIPLLTALAALPADGSARTVALDGRAASGKTTLCASLAEVLAAGVIHMDDFFLPPELRTEARLLEPGGNVHRERFVAEVLPYLGSGEAFSYRRFDCAVRAYAGSREVAASPWRVVEGAYSCHPAFGAYRAFSVFCDVTPEEQLLRIRARDGDAAVKMFLDRWIPCEERYLAAFRIRERADMTLRL